MKCTKCATEITDKKADYCPSCGNKIPKDKFPTWAIIVIIVTPILVTLVIFYLSGLLVYHTIKAENKFENTYTYLNNKERIENFNATKQVNITLKNGVEVKSEKLIDFCERKTPSDVKDYKKENACGVITVDINGFGKWPNLETDGDDLLEVFDQFTLLLFKDRIVPAYNSPEAELLKYVLTPIP